MGDLIKRMVAKLKSDFAALRADLKSALPPSGADEIDQFLGYAVDGLSVSRKGQEIDIMLPLGQDGDMLKRFSNLVQQDRGMPFESAIHSAQDAAKLRNPREQLRQIGIAFLNHQDTYRQLPANLGPMGRAIASNSALVLH
jgi:hypothetical protein